MNMEMIEKFLRYWHETVLLNGLNMDEDKVRKTCAKLIEEIRHNPSLMQLATNPLMCAMIATLYKNNETIPYNRNELYEACCKMLLGARDKAREIETFDFPEYASSEQMQFSYKKMIVSCLAYSMMINGEVESGIDFVIKNIKTSLEKMRYSDTVNAKNLLGCLVERDGILQEPVSGRISFVHKSFQDYLCACEINRSEFWGVLKNHYCDDSWINMISLLVGMCSKRRVDTIITDTLNIPSKRLKKKKTLCAQEYLRGAMEVSKEVSDAVSNEFRKLIPPNDYFEARALAETAGPLAVRYLKYDKRYSYSEQKLCIDALAMVGTVEALSICLEYVEKELSSNTGSINKDFVRKCCVAFSWCFQRYDGILLEQEGIIKRVIAIIEKIHDKKMFLSSGFLWCLCLYMKDSNVSDIIYDVQEIEVDTLSFSKWHLEMPEILTNRITSLKRLYWDYFVDFIPRCKNLRELSLSSIYDISWEILKESNRLTKISILLLNAHPRHVDNIYIGMDSSDNPDIQPPVPSDDNNLSKEVNILCERKSVNIVEIQSVILGMSCIPNITKLTIVGCKASSFEHLDFDGLEDLKEVYIWDSDMDIETEEEILYGRFPFNVYISYKEACRAVKESGYDPIRISSV